MRRFRMTLVAVAAVALAAATAASALVVPIKVPFTASYSGQASTKVDGSVATIAATGKGLGKLIGAGKITGGATGNADSQPCVPFGGTGKMTGVTGTVAFKVLTTSKGCGDEGGHIFALKGYATVLKATGKLANAKGNLLFTGVYDRDGGTFSIKFTGTLKK